MSPIEIRPRKRSIDEEREDKTEQKGESNDVQLVSKAELLRKSKKFNLNKESETKIIDITESNNEEQVIENSSQTENLNIEENEEKIAKFRCIPCKRNFTAKTSLDRHIKTLHLDKFKKHVCKSCKLEFSTRPKLVKHQQIHDTEKEHECEYCSKRFASKSYVKEHIDSKHLNRKKFSCEICDEKFTQKGSLKRHQMTKHQEYLLCTKL